MMFGIHSTLMAIVLLVVLLTVILIPMTNKAVPQSSSMQTKGMLFGPVAVAKAMIYTGIQAKQLYSVVLCYSQIKTE